MKRLALLIGALLLAGAALSDTEESRPGGEATSKGPRNRSAFSSPSGNMPFDKQLDFKLGDGVFRKLWVASPASTKSSDGLGPLHNSRSCQACHLKDGRGRPPVAGEIPSSLIFGLSRPDGSPDPVYGRQLQTFASAGLPAEATVAITHTPKPVTLADGTKVTLRQPHYKVTDPAYGAFDPATTLSPRIAPPMIGRGLMELIPEADIVAHADPDDRDGDGIRGRTRYVASPTETGDTRLGRFGWKSDAANVADQSALAFLNDMGLSTPVYPEQSWGDCTAAQTACRAAPHGDGDGEPEVPAKLFELTVFYARHLAVPARAGIDAPKIRQGQRLFGEIGCAACHTPMQVTGHHPDRPELSGQAIWPYTDMLLHDMGEDLADPGPNGRLWRTPPLWGLGLTRQVNDHFFLMHDGRADGILDAILWHGGEAEKARDRAAGLSKTERDALISFLGSL